jgi:hypothetical protein
VAGSLATRNDIGVAQAAPRWMRYLLRRPRPTPATCCSPIASCSTTSTAVAQARHLGLFELDAEVRRHRARRP